MTLITLDALEQALLAQQQPILDGCASARKLHLLEQQVPDIAQLYDAYENFSYGDMCQYACKGDAESRLHSLVIHAQKYRDHGLASWRRAKVSSSAPFADRLASHSAVSSGTGPRVYRIN